MSNILFVCSANRFRSVLAAERFRTLLKLSEVEGECVVSSAGIWAEEGAAPIKEAVQFASSMQVNIESVRSREVNHRIVSDADLILVMTHDQREAISLEFPQARDKTFLLSDVTIGQSYDIPDPVISPDEDPVEIGQEIFSLIDNGFGKILSRAGNR